MSRQRPLQKESTACGQKLKQQGKMRSGAPEHLLQGCENLSGAPEAKLHDATTFLVCQKHGVRRKNKKIRVEEHE